MVTTAAMSTSTLGMSPTAIGDRGAPVAVTQECAPCVARPVSLPARIAAVRAAIGVETEPLVTLTHLLQLCRDEHPVLREKLNDPGVRAKVDILVADVATLMTLSAHSAVLEPPVRRALAEALRTDGQGEVGVPVVVARALAELLDAHFSASFTASFRRRSPYRPGVGDPIPLDSPNLREVTALPATSPPWRLANRLDETLHVRLAGDWTTQFQVIFDYSHAEALTAMVGPDTIVATCHPNRGLDELQFPVDAAGLTFPVRPVDEQRQRTEIDRLIGVAVAAGAGIVVLPELCVTESLAAHLQQWTCRPDGPRLLVTGSFHHDAHPTAGNQPGSSPHRNTAVAYLRGCPAPLTHDKHSPADRPVREDIHSAGWPELRVHVSDDGWHLVIAICRDLLNPHAVHALTEGGVNLVLVPAMSETLVAFGGPVAQMVGATQAFVAVANNPADFSAADGPGPHRPARALFGHPGFSRQTRLVDPADGEPGVALLRVADGELRWSGAAAATPPSATGTPVTVPPWAEQLRRRCGPDRPWADRHPVQGTARDAAVLVLLTDSPDGPTVLLTERTPDLTDYPGQLVFPGGAADAADRGPVATALREATEEIGLDPSSVQVLGTLPTMVLPESGFLMTPVLAWSPRPVFTGPLNLTEVSTVSSKALGADPAPVPPPDPAAPPTTDGALGVVTGMVIDLVTGMLTHAATG